MTDAAVQPRFLRGVAYIEARLLGPVSLAGAAEQAGFSAPHFSRLFRALVGEPFGAYLRRRRMTVAAERIRAEGGKLRLVELALECGYDSQEAFTRAFKRTFGRPPGEFRAEPQQWSKSFRKPIDAAELLHLRERLVPEPAIEELEATTVVGARERIDEDSTDRIPAIWARFMELLPRIAHAASDSCLGISSNPHPIEGSFDYLAGLPVARVDRLPAGAVAEVLPAGTYASFRHVVRELPLHLELAPTYRWIFGTWLPSSRWEYGAGADFERYPPGFVPAPGATLEIVLPMLPRA
ncbi:MAG TPA: AraC family transcriptional regulator [Myxococcota bacterium]|nr:AraC family transcriptional regulator [Myxococcota bacterium]